MAKNRRSIFVRIMLVASVVLVLTTCDAFNAGLGPKIDIANPSVDITSIKDGAFLKGSISLKGVCSDDVEVQSVDIFVDLGSTLVTTIPTTIKGGIWTATLNTTSFAPSAETNYTLDIRATDTSGKIMDRKVGVFIDNVPPTITSLSPTVDNLNTIQYALSEKENLQVGVTDIGGVAEVDMVIKNGPTLKATSLSDGWNIAFDASQFYVVSSDGTTTAQNGAVKSTQYSGLFDLSYSLVAYDIAGNKSDASKWSGTIYVNPNGAPIVDISGQTPKIHSSTLYPNTPPSDASAMAAWQASTSILNPGDVIRFRIFDMDGIDVSSGQLYMELIPPLSDTDETKLTNGTLNVAPYTYTVGGSSGLSLTESDIMVTSVGGKTIPQQADFSITLPSSLNTTTMPSYGNYQMLIHAADYAANKVSGVSDARDVPAAATPQQYISIYITKGVPVITVSSPTSGQFVKTLTASGVIDDAIGPLAMTAQVEGQTALIPIIPVATAKSTESTWIFTYPSSSPKLSDGNHSVTLTGYGKGGTSSTTTFSFTMDTTPPTVSIQSAAPDGGSYSPTPFTDDTTSSIAVNAPGAALDVVNGKIVFKGYATDSAAIDHCTLNIYAATVNSGLWTVDRSTALETTTLDASSVNAVDLEDRYHGQTSVQ